MFQPKPISPQPVPVTPPCPPQADHDQGWQRERRRSDAGTEQADGGKEGLCP